MSIDAMNRLKHNKDLPGGFSNKEAQGRLPFALPNPLLLNLGCGNDIREGMLNIDLFSNDPNVINMDIRKLDFEDSSVDLILASDILEHFSHREIDSILEEWCRVLKPNAELIIRCPSLKLQMKAYMNGIWNADIASYMIFGGQTNTGDYHCVAFDEQSIREHLEKAGFSIFSYEEHDIPQDKGFINLNMTVRSKKTAIGSIKPIINPSAQTAVETKQDKANNPFTGISFNFNNEEELIDKEELALMEDFVFNNKPQEIEFSPDSHFLHKNKPELNIVWEGSQFVYHSLALINREHCKNILKSNLANLTIVPYEPDDFDYMLYPEMRDLYENDIRFKKDTDENISKNPYVWIRHQWPPKAIPPQGAKWIIMQPWEFSKLRKDFVEIFNQADEIWTPSNYSRQSFVSSGVEFNKVQIVPNGINPELFTPNGKKYDLKSKKKLKFLYVGGTIYRKGIDVLLQSWVKAFTMVDDVCLVIKDIGGNTFYKGQNFTEQIEILQNNPKVAEIIYINENISEEEMADLYRACDVFVSPYRGEGFSLPTLEAMGCGLPVIVTKGGATDDFVDSAFAYLIPSELKSIGNIMDGKEFTEETFLLEPDLEVLTDYLQDIYSNPSTLFGMGILASLTARSIWTWNRATLKAYSRLDALYGSQLAQKSSSLLADNDDVYIHLGIAENAYNDGNYDLARDEYLVVLDDKYLSTKILLHIYHRLSLIYINEGDNLKCDQYLQLCERRYKNHPDTQYIRAIYHASKKEMVEAVEVAGALIEVWKAKRFESTFGITLEDLFVLTGDLFYGSGDLEAANQMYTSALKINNNNVFACFGAALCFKDAGAKEEAITMLNCALKLNPDFDLAINLLEELS